MNRLEILGGPPVLRESLPPYKSIGREEAKAVAQVVESGLLSGFFGDWCDEFFGGPMIRAFEQA